MADDLREALSDISHDIWSHWTRWQFTVCTKNGDGSLTIPAELVERWTRQSATPYAELTEKEKDSDREQADKIIETLRDNADGRLAKAKVLLEKFPRRPWVARPMVDSEQAQEFVLLSPDEVTDAFKLLPAAPDAPVPEPPPVKTEPLRVVYDISVRAGPGRNHAVLGSVSAGTVLTFTDEGAADADYTWRRLAEGFEGAPVAWIAARNVKEARDLLVNPL